MTHVAEAPNDTDTRMNGIQVGQPVFVGRTTGSRLMTLAAASGPADSTDPVDLALRAAVDVEFGGERPGNIIVEDFTPPMEGQLYSITDVRAMQYPDGPVAPRLRIYRGDLDAVLKLAKAGPETRAFLKKNAQPSYRVGYRPLGVATAELNWDGSVGPIRMQGYVPLRAAMKGLRPAVSQIDEYVRIPLWHPTLRVLHWLNVFLITVMTVTGYYIANPFFGPEPTGADSGYFMGWIRMVHFIAAFAWIAMSIVRLFMLFFSRNKLSRWSALWPLKNKHDLRNLWKTVKSYLFIQRHEAPVFLGHNPLQQIAYTAIYGMALLQVLTGLALFGLYNMTSPIWRFFAWPLMFMSIPDLRLLHTVIMILFWVFLVLHLYLAARADCLERHGGMSSMFNGGVWIRKGTITADDPRTFEHLT